MTTLNHIGLTTLVAECARHYCPDFPSQLEWHFAEYPGGFRLYAPITYEAKPATLDLLLTFTPPRATWQITPANTVAYYPNLPEGDLTPHLQPN